LRSSGGRQKIRFRTPLLITITLVVVFALLSLGLKRSVIVRQLESLAISLTSPVLKGIHYLGDSVKEVWQGYFFLVGVRQENELLKRRLEELQTQEVQHQEALQALKRLEALLELKKQLAVPVTGGRVIAYDPSLWSRCAILDKGKNQGVEVGLPVLASQGVVGRIVETFPNYAKVMLIVDRNSGADAMLQRTRGRGILQGKGGNRCALEYVPKNADVQVGDLVLASGLGGIYPPGLVFGKVTAAEKKGPGVFQEIEVTPASDLSSLEEVLVVRTAQYLLRP
jgi:rod shape-determining protein MreC